MVQATRTRPFWLWLRRALIVAALAVVGAAGYAGYQVYQLALALGGPGFTPEGWRSYADLADPRDNKRGTMVAELQDRYLCPGMTRAELVELLGPPDQHRAGVLVYELGYSAFGVDTEAYEFTFDTEGRRGPRHHPAMRPGA